MSDAFIFAYVFIVLATAYSIPAWLFSDALTKIHPRKPILYTSTAPLYDRRTSQLWTWAPTAAIVVVGALSCVFVRWRQINKELDALEGWLYPAHENVETCAPRRPGDFVLLAGSNAYITEGFPLRIISVACDDILKLDLDSNGRVAITTTVRGQDDRVMADIDHGKYVLVPNNVFPFHRPDRSTLRVLDQHKREVLYLHLANAHTLIMRAVLFDKRIAQPIVLGEGSTTMGGGYVTKNCFVSRGLVFHLGQDCRFR